MEKHFYISESYYDFLSKEHSSFFRFEDISLHRYDDDVLLESLHSAKNSKKIDNDKYNQELVLNIVLFEESLFLAKRGKYKHLDMASNSISFILIKDDDAKSSNSPSELIGTFKDVVYHRISFPIEREFFEYIVSSAYTLLENSFRQNVLNRSLSFRKEHIDALTRISMLLYSDLGYNVIIEKIVNIAKEFVVCNDIIISEVGKKNGDIFSRCIFPYTLVEEFTPVDEKTFVGNVALNGKALSLKISSAVKKYSFTKVHNNLGEIKSIMVIPIKDCNKKVRGVVQFINKFKNIYLEDGLSVRKELGISFSDYDMDLAVSLSLHISMAIKLNAVNDRKEDIAELTQIGKALSTERSHSKLLNFILNKSKDITNCDTGTIYLVEEKGDGSKHLRFVYSPLALERKELTIPIDNNSISGYVALTKEVLNIVDAYLVRSGLEYKLNLDYDKKHNYRTKSMLVVPMTNQKDEVTGVIQLINKKRYKGTVLSSPESFEEEVVPFIKDDVDLIMSIAGQAAVSIENNILYNDIEYMLEGFVKASVTAIESRDPTTSGHSERVAKYTIKLARLVSRVSVGKWKNIKFTREQIKELNYASLLHDFGKVGVREDVLVKASKLYPSELELIKSRFDFIKRTLQQESSERRIAYLLERSREESMMFIEKEDISLKKEIEEIDKILTLVIKANDPLIKEGELPLLSFDKIGKMTYKDIYGRERFFLLDNERRSLSIARGSLGLKERQEIESHVTHTFLFLKTIPWTKEFKDLPEIAYAHHEKLDGGGYPRGIKDKEIPLQSKIMTIADIYDALVAGDRPYKKSLRSSYALDILREEVVSSHIDAELVRIFIDGKVYETK